MTEQTNAATPEVVAVEPAAAPPAPTYYEVKLKRRITIQDFAYLPSHQHVVDQSIYDAMEAEGVIADVKQLS
ncbi:hypothetical protein I6F34_00930 [Bradyrhizobium sp. BRP05]|nr:hypothetical protein [Bradyrhizobium sp. BRP05]